MTGKKNPWGGDSGKGGDGDKPTGAQDGDKPKGPRNPWLPPGGNDGRRAPNIEDIFKSRGPEGPRRSGGGGPGAASAPEASATAYLGANSSASGFMGIAARNAAPRPQKVRHSASILGSE